MSAVDECFRRLPIREAWQMRQIFDWFRPTIRRGVAANVFC